MDYGSNQNEKMNLEHSHDSKLSQAEFNFNANVELDKIVQKAQNELNALLSESAIQALLNPKTGDNCSTGSSDVTLHLELGRVQLPERQISSFRPGRILPLSSNEKGIVQLYWEGQWLAAGKLLVINGNLAVEIIRKNDNLFQNE